LPSHVLTGDILTADDSATGLTFLHKLCYKPSPNCLHHLLVTQTAISKVDVVQHLLGLHTREVHPIFKRCPLAGIVESTSPEHTKTKELFKQWLDADPTLKHYVWHYVFWLAQPITNIHQVRRQIVSVLYKFCLRLIKTPNICSNLTSPRPRSSHSSWTLKR
jgi:hypothetical protein